MGAGETRPVKARNGLEELENTGRMVSSWEASMGW